MYKGLLYFLVLFSLPAMAQRGKPVITGQKPLSTNENTSITLRLTDLEVTDSDNWFYPLGFSMKVHKGKDYDFSGTTVTPASGFTGTLEVKVTVNDGRHDSDPYLVKIEIIPINDTPVITGQVALQTLINTPLEIRLSHLTVSDDDDTYPEDFTLLVLPGLNYSINGRTITPGKDFKGTLAVNVKVNDGTSTSANYALKVEVVDVLTIIGQQSLSTLEEQSVTLQLSHLVVRDPKGVYPNGYRLVVLAGQNYSFDGPTVTPGANYAGTLQVSVQVTNGEVTSNRYLFALTVTPANDAPEIIDLETEPIRYSLGNEPVKVSDLLRVADADDNNLMLAEIGIVAADFQPGGDMLVFTNTSAIRGVFDPEEGILSLIGVAPLSAYQEAIRSVQYSFNAEVGLGMETKRIYFKLNDGKNVSSVYERSITMREHVELDIPNAFTPNSDQTNDMWVIVPAKKTERLNQAIIRVYNKRGALVFEAHGFDQPWDGHYKGSLLPSDVYYYTIDLNMQTTDTSFKGSVSLIR